MKPKFFPTPGDFRQWLTENHESEQELWVGYYKKATGKPSLTWPESVEQALCYGWIDGLRKSIDEEAYKAELRHRLATYPSVSTAWLPSWEKCCLACSPAASSSRSLHFP